MIVQSLFQAEIRLIGKMVIFSSFLGEMRNENLDASWSHINQVIINSQKKFSKIGLDLMKDAIT